MWAVTTMKWWILWGSDFSPGCQMTASLWLVRVNMLLCLSFTIWLQCLMQLELKKSAWLWGTRDLSVVGEVWEHLWTVPRRNSVSHYTCSLEAVYCGIHTLPAGEPNSSWSCLLVSTSPVVLMPKHNLTRGCMLACLCQYRIALFLRLNRVLGWGGDWISSILCFANHCQGPEGDWNPLLLLSSSSPAGLCGISWTKTRSQKEGTGGTEIYFPKGS